MAWMYRTALVLALLGAGLVGRIPTVTACTRTAPCGPRQVFLASGTLSITVPAGPVSLGSSAISGTVTNQLGVVTVDDTRLLGLGWTAAVAGSDFKTGGGSPSETIAIGKIQYWSGPATASNGLSSSTPGQATSSQKITLATTAQTAFTGAGISLVSNSASWNPTLIVTVAPSAIAGTYTGTITHTVS